MISRRLLPTLAASLLLTAAASAEEVLAPAPVSGGVVTSETKAPENPLLPDQAPSLVKPEPAATETTTTTTTTGTTEKKEKVSKTEVAEQDLMERIHYREAKTKALADPKIIAAWDRANLSRTDISKRTALLEYYKLLFDRIVKIDSTLAKAVALKKLDAEHRVMQVRIAPTVDTNPSTSLQLTAD